MDRLSPLDTAFLDAEDADRHVNMAIASVAVIEGPPPSQDEYVRGVGAVLASIPRARQKVRRVPGDLGLPIWVDDPNFDPGYHFRRTALPAPGDDAALSTLVARIMSQRLDRDRPLWESWVIEGLAGGRWAVLTKVHHCLADGVSGTQLYGMIFSASPDTAHVSVSYQPTETDPGAVRLLVTALGDLARSPVEQLRLLTRALRSPDRVVDLARGLAELVGVVRPASPSSLSGSIGQARRYGMARASLSAVTRISKRFDVTVNDVVLTAISGALRKLLLHRGEIPDAHAVRTLVPVSVRSPDEKGVLDNRISVLLPFLPVDIADPVEALAEVRARMLAAKGSGEAEAGASLTELATHEPFAPISAAIRLATRLPQRNIITVTTNVPGPRQPLFVLGRKMVELLPYVPIAVRLRIGIAIITYCDNVVFGITGDYERAPDVQLLAEAIEQGIGELAGAAGSKWTVKGLSGGRQARAKSV
jgi:WS/DGAT/MGAT family acyltransferase